MLAAGVLGVGALVWRQVRASQDLLGWFIDPGARSDLMAHADLAPCPGAPFILPSSGFVGLLWADTRLPYSQFSQHSGIDIFGDGVAGQIPVYAAYDGYLTRLAHWKSAVIIRHPQDPLTPSRQIWTYYAHMASEQGDSFIVDAFPPGSSEVPVKQGALLGYQGDYNGGNGRVGLHLHFSIVRDSGAGQFLNETSVKNTLDPSPYLGMQVSFACARGVPQCTTDLACR